MSCRKHCERGARFSRGIRTTIKAQEDNYEYIVEEVLKHKIKIINGDCNYSLGMTGTYLKKSFC
jgi:hypothetical protein